MYRIHLADGELWLSYWQNFPFHFKTAISSSPFSHLQCNRITILLIQSMKEKGVLQYQEYTLDNIVMNVKKMMQFFSLSLMQKSSSSCQLRGRHQISSAHHLSPSTKQKPASALHSQRRNSYSGGSKFNNHEPSSPVPRHGRSHLLSSTYHPKHSLLTRGGGNSSGVGGGGGRTGLVTESGGTASKQGGGLQGPGQHGSSRSHRQPPKNDTSDLIVTSARIVSSLFLSPIFFCQH